MHLIKSVYLHQTTVYPPSTKAVCCPHTRNMFELEQRSDLGPLQGTVQNVNGTFTVCSVLL